MNNPFNIGDRVHIMNPSELGITDIPIKEYFGLDGTILCNYPEDGHGTYTGTYMVKVDGTDDTKTMIDAAMLRYPDEPAWKAMERKGMGPEFKQNQIVMIIQDDYRGRLGMIRRLITKYYGEYEYRVSLLDPKAGINFDNGLINAVLENGRPEMTMPPYAMIMYTINGADPVCRGDQFKKIEPLQQKQMIQPEFDFSKYLDEKTMSDMATKIFEEKFSAFVDEIIENRSINSSSPDGHNIIDYLVGITVDKIAKELAAKYEDKIMEIIGYELEREEPYKNDDCYDIFKVQLGNTLHSVANNYISTHMDEINETIKGPVRRGVEEITSKNFQQTVIKKLTDSYNKILADTLINTLESDSKSQ